MDSKTSRIIRATCLISVLLIVSGGASLIDVSCVGFVNIPFSFNHKHISQAETGESLVISIALNNPLPRISLI